MRIALRCARVVRAGMGGWLGRVVLRGGCVSVVWVGVPPNSPPQCVPMCASPRNRRHHHLTDSLRQTNPGHPHLKPGCAGAQPCPRRATAVVQLLQRPHELRRVEARFPLRLPSPAVRPGDHPVARRGPAGAAGQAAGRPGVGGGGDGAVGDRRRGGRCGRGWPPQAPAPDQISSCPLAWEGLLGVNLPQEVGVVVGPHPNSTEGEKRRNSDLKWAGGVGDQTPMGGGGWGATSLPAAGFTGSHSAERTLNPGMVSSDQTPCETNTSTRIHLKTLTTD